MAVIRNNGSLIEVCDGPGCGRPVTRETARGQTVCESPECWEATAQTSLENYLGIQVDEVRI